MPQYLPSTGSGQLDDPVPPPPCHRLPPGSDSLSTAPHDSTFSALPLPIGSIQSQTSKLGSIASEDGQNSCAKLQRQESNAVNDVESAKTVANDRAATQTKAKRTRNRKPASCEMCRRKKLRCNRVDPCDQCTAKGQEDMCTWEGAEPLYTRRNEADTQDLRDQVARLESLVRYLTAQKNEEEARSSRQLSSRSNSPASPALIPFPSDSAPEDTQTRDSVPSLSPPSQHPPKPSNAIDLRAHDLCEGIAQLAVKEFVVVEGSGNDSWAPGHQRGLEMIDEARLFLRTMPQQFGVSDSPSFSLPSSSSSSLNAHSRQASNPQLSDQVSPRSPTDSTFSSISRSSMISPGALGTSSFGSNPPSLDEVLKYLPTNRQAHSAYRYYVDYVSWYAHAVHQSSFEEKWRSLDAALKLSDEETRIRAIDPFFIATFLGIIATGLSMMPIKRALRDGFGEDKDRIVDHWLEGSMLALTCGGFLDNPSVEAVSATVILSTFFVFTATGERAGAGVGLLSLGVQSALSLGLHRDPDKSPGRFSFFEAEERRRLFWNLFMLCILSSSSLSRTWSIFDLRNVDCRLPLDCHDHEILDAATAQAGIEQRRTKFEETPMTSLIVKMRLAILAKKMNDRAFGIEPVPYEEVLALDAELKEFEETIPARYRLRFDASGALLRPTTHLTVTEMRSCMILISLTCEFIRLHRPWLLLSGENKLFQYSRDQAIKYSRILLAVYRSPSCNKSKWGGLQFKATNAAIVLAVDVLAFPEQAEVEVLRSTVRAVHKQMSSQAGSSSLCRKGSRLIQFLLDKDVMITSQKEERRRLKRTKSGSATSPSLSGLRAAFDSRTVRGPVFMHEREDDDEPDYHHKVSPNGSSHEPAPDPSSASTSLRAIAKVPSHSPPLYQPLPDHMNYPFQRSPASGTSLSTNDFAQFAGAFDFDFSLPPSFPPSRPSPALSHPYLPPRSHYPGSVSPAPPHPTHFPPFHPSRS
ncbi:hypothetical protein JCM11491_000075 [Sporobolomyces phaffii]